MQQILEQKLGIAIDVFIMNSFTLASIVAMIIDRGVITWVLGCAVALTMIWFNSEKALKTRRERKLLNSKAEPLSEDEE
jgi:hypothetical protein